MSTEIVPFGKYKDQPIERLLGDVDYLDWVKGQAGVMRMLESRHPALFNIIVTGGPESEDTPEHNSFQLRFFERPFQEAFIGVVLGKSVSDICQGHVEASRAQFEKELLEVKGKSAKHLEDLKECEVRWLKEKPDGYYTKEDLSERLADTRRDIAQAKSRIEALERFILPAAYRIDPGIKVEMECGFDVELNAWWHEERFRFECGYSGIPKLEESGAIKYQIAKVIEQQKCFKIELKPQLGDDFPSVLRQMERNGAYYLVIGAFGSRSASLEQLRAYFGSKKRQVVTIADIEANLEKDTAVKTAELNSDTNTDTDTIFREAASLFRAQITGRENIKGTNR